MSRAAVAFVFLAAFVTSAAGARAQNPVVLPKVAVGDRVRVWTDLDLVSGFLATRGEILSVDRDTLVIREDYNDTLPRHIPTAAVTRLDLSRGVISRVDGIKRGARLGAVAGLAAAPLLVLRDRRPGDSLGAYARSFGRSALLTSAEGALIGSFLGTALRHTLWERVYERHDVSLSPGIGGLAVAMKF